MPITHLPLDHLLSSTSPEDFPARRQLSDVSTAIAKARRVVVVSGAGISCSSGIPDFRSADGLYSLVKSKYPDNFLSGKELFSSGLFSNPLTTSIFYTFIAELSLECQKAQPTKTHHFIRKLENKKKLLRSYTQNIDGLERRLGLESGGRGKGFHKKSTKNIELHGDLGRVRCVLCQKDFEVLKEHTELFRNGEAPDCPACEERCQSRISRSARATSVGTLRPSIVLYDEPHPLGDDIGSVTTYDLSRQPDLLLIMGTSLKVHGLKRLVKEFAKSVHSSNIPSSSTASSSSSTATSSKNKKKGIVVFVNATPPAEKEWEGVIDYHIQGETDKWVEKVEEEWRKIKPSDWETQTRLDGEMIVTAKPRAIKGKGKAKGKPVTNSDQNDEPVQLPTPRPTASPRSPVKHQKDTKDLHFPSSPIPSQNVFKSTYMAAESDSDLSDAPPTPPTPRSPSKRRSNAFDSPSKKTKSFDKDIPLTGLSSTPGKGNLFSLASNFTNDRFPVDSGKENKEEIRKDNDDEWVDEWEVFNTPPNMTPKKSQSQSTSNDDIMNKSKSKSSKVLAELKENITITQTQNTSTKTRSARNKVITVGSPRVRRKRTAAVKA